MRRLRQEDQDEGRNVRRRPTWWNVFNRPFWNPFTGEPRPQQRQQVVPFPPEDPVEAEPGAEDVNVEDEEDVETNANAERAAEPRDTGFLTARGTNLLLHPNNVNSRPFSRSFLRRIRFSKDQRLDNRNRAEETAEQERINVNPEAARRYQNMLIVERRTALKWDTEQARIRRNKLIVQLMARWVEVAQGNYTDGDRLLAELDARIATTINNRDDDDDDYHEESDDDNDDIHVPDNLPEFMYPGELEIDSYFPIHDQYYHARPPPQILAETLSSLQVPYLVYRRYEQSRTLNPSDTVLNEQHAQNERQSPTGFPYQPSSRNSTPNIFDRILSWSEMVRDEWNTHLLQRVLSLDDDVDYISALRLLNVPNVYCHICNNKPITLVGVSSYPPLGLHEGSPYHRFNELFFYGVSFILIDQCPIAAPGGTAFLGKKNAAARILGKLSHDKIMTTLEGILRSIILNNQAIIFGCGNAGRYSGNLPNIIGNYYAHHPCCIYAGNGNIDNDYDAIVIGAKLQMKLFGYDNSKTKKIIEWIHGLKLVIMSKNRLFTRDAMHVALKKEQKEAWKLFRIYIDVYFNILNIHAAATATATDRRRCSASISRQSAVAARESKRKAQERSSEEEEEEDSAGSTTDDTDQGGRTVRANDSSSSTRSFPPGAAVAASTFRLSPSQRQERNAREQARSSRIAQQIEELRALLVRGGVPLRTETKSAVLIETAQYIRRLQQQQQQQQQAVAGGVEAATAAPATAATAATKSESLVNSLSYWPFAPISWLEGEGLGS